MLKNVYQLSPCRSICSFFARMFCISYFFEQANRHSPAINHLFFFADDCYTFLQETVASCKESTRQIFTKYCSISGQLLNEGKSELYVSTNYESRQCASSAIWNKRQLVICSHCDSTRAIWFGSELGIRLILLLP